MAPRKSLLAAAVLVFAAACVVSACAASDDAVSGVPGRQEVSWRQQLASGNPQGRRLLASNDAAAGTNSDGGGRSYTWLKWTAAAILFVEAFIGVLVPVGLKLTAHATWLLSLVNCFAGGVFLTFGIMHIGPDALAAQDDIGLDRFPLAAFFIALSFMCIFFLHRILAPALRLTPHQHAHYPATTPDGRSIMPKASKANGVAACQRCGDECGCDADSCNCAHHIDHDPEAEEAKANAAAFGSTAATITNAVTPATRPYEDELQPAPRPTRGQRIAAIVPPTLILGGLLAHTVLEGLTIGLQQSYGDVVSAFIALASHRWVESIAVSAAFVAAGTGIWAIIAFLSVFSVGPLVGIAIGVSVADTNNWAILVLFGITSGLFIYVGSVGITAEEFAKCDDPAFAASRPRGARFYMYACMFFGFVVVALLQLVPDD